MAGAIGRAGYRKAELTMTHSQILLCAGYALSLALGQILFKLAADAWVRASGSQATLLSALSPWAIAAAVWYAGVSLLWMYILRSVELSRAYVFVLAGSALVPVVAWLLFKEELTARYAAGAALILVGAYLCTVR
jgi:undecaprenyl phosphate-alpha-L-ara4N flippase subunit ArnE